MEQKIYYLTHLDCAHCAAKIEAKLNTLPEVESAVIVFATRQLRLTAADPEALLPRLQTIVSSIEPDARITTDQEADQGHSGCSCGHCRHDREEHQHHTHSEKGYDTLILGAALFALGLLLSRLGYTALGAVSYCSAYLVLGHTVLVTAVKNLFRGHIFDENFLMSIATLGAFAIGELPEAVGVMLFYRVGEYFEGRAVARSRSQIMDAVDLRPETVTLWDGQIIPAREAEPGDLLLIRPGDRIGLDGCVFSGESQIDTAPITGEPVPVTVRAGDPVLSGCMNLSGQLVLQVTNPLSESMVTRILHAVESAAAGKPKIDRFITRFARVYTPVVVGIAALTAVIPSLITGQWNHWVYTALSFLVMSCPCALVLSVPLAFFSGIGVGSKKGILFKGGASIEALALIRGVAMDKTGTLTKGDFRVQQICGDVLALAASCEQHSTHPIAASIVTYARQQGIRLTHPETLEELPGHGIHGQIGGKQVLCGNAKLLERFGISCPAAERSVGTTVFVAVDGTYAGHLLISDTIKEGADRAVEQLHAMGLQTALLTGDQQQAAEGIAKTVGIRQVFAKLLPQQKLTVLQQLRTQWGSTLFVGDGINDAPVLAGADVGAAMGSGSDAAIEAADVVFMTRDVQAIPQAIRIAGRTRRIALQNVVFALVIKAVVMVLGLAGFANMWLAVFADSGVAMLCVLNSIRQLYRK